MAVVGEIESQEVWQEGTTAVLEADVDSRSAWMREASRQIVRERSCWQHSLLEGQWRVVGVRLAGCLLGEEGCEREGDG